MVMFMERRRFVLGTLSLAAAASAPRLVFAQTPSAPVGPFKLDPLPYANNALKDHSNVASMPLQDILAKLSEMPEQIRTVLRNNGGGHANHTMFWQVMGPGGGQPSGDLATAITRDLGGLEKLQNDFNAAGGRVFGSGWVFITVDREGKLALETKPNQDTPLMDGKRALLGNDVWEHAYYLTYQNRRPDYLKAWWNTVNWNKVGERYAAAKSGSLTI